MTNTSANAATINTLPQLSIVIPTYNSESRIVALLNATVDLLNDTNSHGEIIVVDDHSTDQTWQVLTNYKPEKYVFIKRIRLAQNNGQYASTVAGINQAAGLHIITIDDDFSPPPAELVKLLVKQGLAPLIYAILRDNNKNIFRRMASSIMHFFISATTGNKQLEMGSSCRLFSQTLWRETKNALSRAEKLDIELIKNAKDNILFTPVISTNRNSSHTILKLFKVAITIALPKLSKQSKSDTLWQQNIIIEHTLVT